MKIPAPQRRERRGVAEAAVPASRPFRMCQCVDFVCHERLGFVSRLQSLAGAPDPERASRSQALMRVATARNIPEPSAAGRHPTRRVIGRSLLRGAELRPRAAIIRSWRWASAIVYTALAWIILYTSLGSTYSHAGLVLRAAGLGLHRNWKRQGPFRTDECRLRNSC